MHISEEHREAVLAAVVACAPGGMCARLTTDYEGPVARFTYDIPEIGESRSSTTYPMLTLADPVVDSSATVMMLNEIFRARAFWGERLADLSPRELKGFENMNRALSQPWRLLTAQEVSLWFILSFHHNPHPLLQTVGYPAPRDSRGDSLLVLDLVNDPHAITAAEHYLRAAERDDPEQTKTLKEAIYVARIQNVRQTASKTDYPGVGSEDAATASEIVVRLHELDLMGCWRHNARALELMDQIALIYEGMSAYQRGRLDHEASKLFAPHTFWQRVHAVLHISHSHLAGKVSQP